MAEYALLLVLWWRALSRRSVLLSSLTLAWILTVLYAASDEVHQTFVPGRNGRAMDVLIDASGASLAVLGLWLANRSK